MTYKSIKETHHFNHLLHEILIQFSLAVWFHSLPMLPAVGFKAYQQYTNIWKQGALYNPPWALSDVSTHRTGNVQNSEEIKQVEIELSSMESLGKS